MRRSTRRARIATELVARVAAVATGVLLIATSTAVAAPVRFRVELGGDARPGATTSLTFRLRVSSELPPVTEFRVLTPSGMDLSTTGLGVATCVRPLSEVLDVMHTLYHRPCPANSLMGTGSATAQLRFDPEDMYSGAARIALYAGESVGDKPGLLVIADTFRPMRTQFSYQGYLYVPPRGFGLGMAIKVTPIPKPPFGAPVALSSFRLVVGRASLRYTRVRHGRRETYRPRAIPVPRTCSRHGLGFRAIVRFAGGLRLVQDARAACPHER
ncbi:MAG TPA: hypothetical protein VFG42_02315 [Baekduia sp.]|uniref:hypothetical protein n=1 Tax=Baekduia sp. TaxID=2600305 RepID=UPI002D775C48|nr:hypothetical protein [Baekduia sp.]HET6505601.1 hypothetical protein [Baekduia sp.]